MKTIIIFSVLFSISAYAKDTRNQKICDALSDKAINNCKVSMCEEWLTDQGEAITKKGIDECLANSDGDLLEGAQICAIDGGELESLIKDYNRKNPKKKINCEDN